MHIWIIKEKWKKQKKKLFSKKKKKDITKLQDKKKGTASLLYPTFTQ
jgi:hypothetical protein